MNRLDKTAAIVVAATLLLIGSVIILGTRIPLVITCLLADQTDLMSPFGAVDFEFSRPVQASKIEKLWQISPPVQGRWDWINEKHARWYSLQALPVGAKFELAFNPGEGGIGGERLVLPLKWEFQIRPPQILGMRVESSGNELFSYEITGNDEAKQLTHTDGLLYDFASDPAGQLIIYSVVNDSGGIDLWQMDRDGSNRRILLSCGVDRCTSPAWSMVSSELAYTRQNGGIDPNGPIGAPRIWMLDTKTGLSSPLFTDNQEIGYGAKWSPDGQWLSIWDGASGGIKIVNRMTNKNFLLESSSGNGGCWSFDNRHMFFSNTIISETNFHNVILKADRETGEVETVFGGNNNNGEGMSIDNPACNPVGNQVVVTMQPNVKIPGRSIELFDLDENTQISIFNDLSVISGSYSWNFDGDQLLFQVDHYGSIENNIENWIWKDGTARRMTNGLRFPQWLP
jgi:Tol biopolymer transport system component